MKLRPQARNANRHTVRGMQALETSIATDGWIGAITVAADGETFDGSARVEKTAENGMLDDVIVVDSDGTRPIVVRRTDIPNATDERAVRLGLAANRVASLNLEWEPGVLAEIAKDMDLSSLFSADELTELMQAIGVEPGAGGDEFDPTPDDGPTRTNVGELWSIGPHRLLVGDCTDAANVARLMGGERADIVFTSPPYNRGTSTGGGFNDKGMSQQLTNAYDGYADDLPKEQYQEWQRGLLLQWWGVIADDGAIYYNHRPRVQAGIYETPLDWNPDLPVRQIVIWHSGAGINFAPTHYRPACEWIVLFAKEGFRLDSKSASGCGDVWDIPVAPRDDDHPAPFPVALPQRALETTGATSVYDPFAGTGTTLIAAHRTERRCYGMEIAPRYADVILRRAEAEGLECILDSR